MSKRRKGGSHAKAPKRKTGKAVEQDAEVTAAEERYAEMRTRGKESRDIRVVAIARNDEVLASLCDEVIAGTREEPMLTPEDDADATNMDATDETVSGAGDADDPEPESSPEECRYIELRSAGKTPRQVRALAESRNDHDLYEYSDEIIRGTREEPEGEYPDAEDGSDDADITDGDKGDDGDDGEDVSASGEDAEDAGDADNGDAPAETDARPVVTVEELRSIDLELTGLINRFREAAGEMNHLRGVLAELQRSRKAMGPVARAPRPPREPGAPRGISLIAAAANLLAENGLTMNCTQIVKDLADKGIWQSLNGKTPAATLYSAVGSEIRAKGDQARFACEGKGLYRASTHGVAVFRAAQANAGPEA